MRVSGRRVRIRGRGRRAISGWPRGYSRSWVGQATLRVERVRVSWRGGSRVLCRDRRWRRAGVPRKPLLIITIHGIGNTSSPALTSPGHPHIFVFPFPDSPVGSPGQPGRSRTPPVRQPHPGRETGPQSLRASPRSSGCRNGLHRRTRRSRLAERSPPTRQVSRSQARPLSRACFDLPVATCDDGFETPLRDPVVSPLQGTRT
jgi:hypothetical protein